MNLSESLFLGVLQGFTEFLPVSSSGHLFLAEKFFGLTQDLPFEIALHFASLLAIFIFFRKDIWEIIHSMYLKATPHSSLSTTHSGHAQYGLKLITATLITFPVALLTKDFVFDNLTVSLVAVTLIITGVLILVAEKIKFHHLSQKLENPIKKNRETVSLTWSITVILGVIQGLTVIPGISRSGTTIALLLLLGLGRQFAAKTSFLLAIPTILGAMLYTLHESGWTLPLSPIQLIGCVASFFAAIIAIKFMMKLIEKHWIWFAPYCLGLGIFLLIFR